MPMDEIKLFHQNFDLLTKMIMFFDKIQDCYHALINGEVYRRPEQNIYIFILRLFEKLRYTLGQANKYADDLYDQIHGKKKLAETKPSTMKRRYDLGDNTEGGNNSNAQNTIAACVERMKLSKYRKGTQDKGGGYEYERYKIAKEKEMREREKMIKREANSVAKRLEFQDRDKPHALQQLDDLLFQADKFLNTKNRSIKLSPLVLLSKLLTINSSPTQVRPVVQEDDIL